jgi:hypothetical protein
MTEIADDCTCDSLENDTTLRCFGCGSQGLPTDIMRDLALLNDDQPVIAWTSNLMHRYKNDPCLFVTLLSVILALFPSLLLLFYMLPPVHFAIYIASAFLVLVLLILLFISWRRLKEWHHVTAEKAHEYWILCPSNLYIVEKCPRRGIFHGWTAKASVTKIPLSTIRSNPFCYAIPPRVKISKRENLWQIGHLSERQWFVDQVLEQAHLVGADCEAQTPSVDATVAHAWPAVATFMCQTCASAQIVQAQLAYTNQPDSMAQFAETHQDSTSASDAGATWVDGRFANEQVQMALAHPFHDSVPFPASETIADGAREGVLPAEVSLPKNRNITAEVSSFNRW